MLRDAVHDHIVPLYGVAVKVGCCGSCSCLAACGPGNRKRVRVSSESQSCIGAPGAGEDGDAGHEAHAGRHAAGGAAAGRQARSTALAGRVRCCQRLWLPACLSWVPGLPLLSSACGQGCRGRQAALEVASALVFLHTELNVLHSDLSSRWGQAILAALLLMQQAPTLLHVTLRECNHLWLPTAAWLPSLLQQCAAGCWLDCFYQRSGCCPLCGQQRAQCRRLLPHARRCGALSLAAFATLHASMQLGIRHGCAAAVPGPF